MSNPKVDFTFSRSDEVTEAIMDSEFFEIIKDKGFKFFDAGFEENVENLDVDEFEKKLLENLEKPKIIMHHSMMHNTRYLRAVITSTKYTLFVSITQYRVGHNIAAESKEIIEEIKTAITKSTSTYMKVSTDEKPRISFCVWTPQGFKAFDRVIECPSWDSIADNYPNSDKIKELIDMKKPDNAGKLIFWHGSPGVGKTTAIRALIRSWNKKAKFYYILDPEIYFGNPSYMLEVIMGNRMYSGEDIDDDEDDDCRMPRLLYTKKKESKLKVIIVEDGLRILKESMRKVDSEGMGRLLNLTDGMVGQGLRVLVLITTNEPIKDIDPAYLRHGRCLQSLEFPELNVAQSVKWAMDNKCELKEEKSFYSLAELYAYKFNREVTIDKIIDDKVVGFGA